MSDANTEEMRMREEMRGATPTARINGPSLLMLCDENTPQPTTGTLLMVPMTNYTKITIQACWMMIDPSHLAVLQLVQTSAEFPGDEGTIWKPLVGLYNPEELPGSHDPHQLSFANAAMIRCYGVKATAIGAVLFTWPSDAKLQARIWMLMEEGRQTP